MQPSRSVGPASAANLALTRAAQVAGAAARDDQRSSGDGRNYQDGDDDQDDG